MTINDKLLAAMNKPLKKKSCKKKSFHSTKTTAYQNYHNKFNEKLARGKTGKGKGKKVN